MSYLTASQWHLAFRPWALRIPAHVISVSFDMFSCLLNAFLYLSSSSHPLTHRSSPILFPLPHLFLLCSPWDFRWPGRQFTAPCISHSADKGHSAAVKVTTATYTWHLRKPVVMDLLVYSPGSPLEMYAMSYRLGNWYAIRLGNVSKR